MKRVAKAGHVSPQESILWGESGREKTVFLDGETDEDYHRPASTWLAI